MDPRLSKDSYLDLFIAEVPRGCAVRRHLVDIRCRIEPMDPVSVNCTLCIPRILILRHKGALHNVILR